MNEIGGNYFDGETSRSLGVVLRLCRDGRIDIEGSGFEYHTHVRDVRVSHRLGSTPRAIYLGNNSKVEVLDNDAIDAFLETQGLDRSWRWVSRIERAPLLIGLALVLTVSCIYVFVEYGLPVLARHIAESIPQEVEDGMSNTALEFLDTHVFQLSNLPAARQGELRDLFSGLTETTLPDRPLRFEFRRSDFIGPNAFALPSGIVVFTDALVDLAADDRELVAVMAHEVGHVVQRHSLRHLLQTSATALLIASVTGDFASLSGLAATLPTVMLESKYSREFETEADDYAFQFLTDHGIATRHFANIVLRLMTESEHGEEGVLRYLSTHPLTTERAERFQTVE